ncbi:helicase [Candidatus Parcubacteria bacterium]|nr:MAG: helicase [Candidatus Parcubacteria bacterium]
MNHYRDFLEGKKTLWGAYGKPVSRGDIHEKLFPFQRDLTYWAARKGKSAIFADCGLGKTFMQLEWARLLDERTLIIAPLSVARQTVREAEKLGLTVKYIRDCSSLEKLNITNYEMLDHINPALFGAVVLDESSILKSIAGKTREKLIEMFQQTNFKLCCTATPAPNDIAEIANHAEFLSVATRNEMLSTFFVHDAEGWRLKRHAVEPFYRWLASWSMNITKPSDFGYEDNGFILPPLTVAPVFVRSNYKPQDELFATGLSGIADRCKVRGASISDRIEQTKKLLHARSGQWVIWCNLNKEADVLIKELANCREIKGADSLEMKLRNIEDFQDGKYRILITKPSICGFGLNLQNCENQLFFGLSDSWESYYQCIRRSWRFGQTKPVSVHIVLTDIERVIYENVMEKAQAAETLTKGLIENIAIFEKEEIGGINLGDSWRYEMRDVKGENYYIMLGDSCERMKELPAESIHLSVFSPPFASLYTYSSTERDLGNCKDEAEFLKHFDFIIEELYRVTIPGRICAVHVFDIPAMLIRDNFIGLKDFSGDVIRQFINHGWIYDARIPIDKNQQAQSIRTHSKALTMTQLEKDRSWLRPALPDYILKFRKPGENPAPVVNGGVTRDQWIEYAAPTWPDPIADRCAEMGAFPTWYGIRETDTLQGWRTKAGHRNTGGKDEKHICPLQLETISRIIRLWSNEHERIFTPFMGIGSEVYQAISLNRYGIGIELKPEYFELAVEYLSEYERGMELFAS